MAAGLCDECGAQWCDSCSGNVHACPRCGTLVDRAAAANFERTLDSAGPQPDRMSPYQDFPQFFPQPKVVQ